MRCLFAFCQLGLEPVRIYMKSICETNTTSIYYDYNAVYAPRKPLSKELSRKKPPANFNVQVFRGLRPPCTVTFSRHSGVAGSFRGIMPKPLVKRITAKFFMCHSSSLEASQPDHKVVFCISSQEGKYSLTLMRTSIGKISYLLLSRDILDPKPIWRSANTGAKSTLTPLVRLTLKANPYFEIEVEHIIIRSDMYDTTNEDDKKVHDSMPSIPLQKPLEKVLGRTHRMAPYCGCLVFP